MIYAPARDRYVLPVSTAVEPVEPTTASMYVMTIHQRYRRTDRRMDIGQTSHTAIPRYARTRFAR